MRGQRSSMKSRSVPRVTEFTFRSWMPTSTCQAYWRACWDPRNGWLPGSVRLAANPEAEPRKRLPGSMADWADDPGSLLRVNVQPGSLTSPARTATLDTSWICAAGLVECSVGAVPGADGNPWPRPGEMPQEAGAAASDALLQLDPQCRGAATSSAGSLLPFSR